MVSILKADHTFMDRNDCQSLPSVLQAITLYTAKCAVSAVHKALWITVFNFRVLKVVIKQGGTNTF